jgi:hypothetical protein
MDGPQKEGSMDIPLDLFEKSIQRIKTTCDLIGHK